MGRHTDRWELCRDGPDAGGLQVSESKRGARSGKRLSASLADASGRTYHERYTTLHVLNPVHFPLPARAETRSERSDDTPLGPTSWEHALEEDHFTGCYD